MAFNLMGFQSSVKKNSKFETLKFLVVALGGKKDET